MNDKSHSSTNKSKLETRRKRWSEKMSLINTSSCRFDILRQTASELKIQESADNWDILWTDVTTTVEKCRNMKRYQRTNHFPGMMEICQKHFLARNLNRFLKAFPHDYKIFPKTWCLRSDIFKVVEHAKSHKEDVFIVKPDFGCQGRGIKITRNVNQLRDYDEMICQIYIQKPFLIDGYKFDLRIYVLITSCDPLRVFVYNEGLARFATEKYEKPCSSNYNNEFMHLTNYSVNKHSVAYLDDEDGSKRKLSTIRKWFQRNNYDVKKIWDSVDDVIIKTVLVSLPTLKHYYRTAFPNQRNPHACFEILGFDFLFDYRLKPYLLEVNHSPSFYTDTKIDLEVKESLLRDAFVILSLQQSNRVKVQNHNLATQARIVWENEHMGDFRKIYPCVKQKYYDKFIGCAQSSLFSATVSSRAKERVKDSARKLPRGTGSTRSGSCLTESHRSRKAKKPKSLLQRVFSDAIMADSQPRKMEKHANEQLSLLKTRTLSDADDLNHIDEVEERDRILSRSKRESLLKSHGVFQNVYDNLRSAGLLTGNDAKIKRDEKMVDTSEVEGGFSNRLVKFLETVTTKTGCILSEKANNFMQMLSISEQGFVGDRHSGGKSNAQKAANCNFESCFIDADEENERISGMMQREVVLMNENVHVRVYDNLKKAGVLKLEDQIKAVLSKRWSGRGHSVGKALDNLRHMDDKVVKVLNCLWNKTGPKLEAKFGPALGFVQLAQNRVPGKLTAHQELSKNQPKDDSGEKLSYTSVTSTPSESSTTLFTVLETWSLSTEVWGTPDENSEHSKIHNGSWRNP